MNDTLLMYAVSSKLLRSFKPPLSAAFSAWLHFDRPWTDADEEVVASLIKNGCRTILITGSEAELVHERVDYIAYDLTDELVLTLTNTEADKSAALEFISTRCPKSPPSFFLISSFSVDQSREVISLGDNLKLVGIEMSHYQI